MIFESFSELENRLLRITCTVRGALRTFGVFDLNNDNQMRPIKCWALSVIQDEVCDFDRFRRDTGLVSRCEPLNSNSHKPVCWHEELKRLARGPRLMKLMSVPRSSYFVYFSTGFYFHECTENLTAIIVYSPTFSKRSNSDFTFSRYSSLTCVCALLPAFFWASFSTILLTLLVCTAAPLAS